MPLYEVRGRNAKPKVKPYKLSDSEDLYLYVTGKGGKLWRFKYRFDNDGKGKRKMIFLLNLKSLLSNPG